MSKKSRTENSVRNVSYGLIVTVINTLIAFVNRTVFVKILGEEALGLNGLFTEVISVISLAELGVGMAIIYYLYKPFHEGDTKRISQLMSLYKVTYTAIAAVVFVMGLLVTPVIDFFITDITYELSYIRLVFMLFVIKTASSYLFVYKTSLLNVDQKQFVVSLASVIAKAAFTVLSVIALIFTRNYIVYLLLMIGQTVSVNLVLSWYVDKKYPYVDYKQKMSKEDRKVIFGDIKNIFIKRVSGVVTSSTDNILISKLVSTIQVGLYSNYVVLFNMVRTLKQQLTNGIAASIGNLSVTETPEKCIMVKNRLTFLFFAFAMVISTGLVAVSNPFVTIWLGSEFTLNEMIVYVAIFNLFLEITSDPLWQYLEVSGLFKQDKNIGIIGSSVNLLVSVVLGMRIGMTGIFIGTVSTQVIQIILKTRLLYRNKFGKSPFGYYRMWVKMVLCFVGTAAIQILINRYCVIPNLFAEFLVKGVLSVVLSVTVTVGAFWGSEELNYSKGLVLGFLRKLTGKRSKQNGV